MYKVVKVGSWDFDMPAMVMIKVSSRGLCGHDRKDFLEKRAGAHVFADRLDDITLGKGEIPIHLLAIGSTEAYGPNRNGDGFKEATNKRTHGRFVKDANYYRHHKNKDPDNRYGEVKLSAYNDPMRRIELLIIGNATKEAARRNGGLVMPGETVDKLERGEEVPFSMACKVAYDVCSNCGNKAASRDEYCTDDTCVSSDGFRGFGCKTGLTKIASNGFQQHVDNPDPFFFDISEVVRPADRIAYGWQADYLQKAAADVMGGAELYEMFTSNTPSQMPLNVAIAHKLASIEKRFSSGQTERERSLARGVHPSMQSPVDLAPLGRLGSTKMATGLTALAGQKIVLSLSDFLRLAIGDDAEKVASVSASVSQHLPGVYGRMIADGSLSRYIQENPLCPTHDSPPNLQEKWAASLIPGLSLHREAVGDRIRKSAITKKSEPLIQRFMEKTAATDEHAEAVARRYAAYKLASLGVLDPNDADFELTLELAILQNLTTL